ncbi:MAG: SulP family inorganic anion transporter [Butyricicoccaceae bacterium]
MRCSSFCSMVFFPKKWNAVVPASLIGIIIATAATMICSSISRPSATFRRRSCCPIACHRLRSTGTAVPALLAPAFSIAVLEHAGEPAVRRVSAGRATGVKLNNDQELFAQGVGNMVLPMFGGIPATAALARTSVAVRSGAQTRLTGIFHAVGLLIMMLVLAPIISNVPLAALAGVLMVTAWRMNEWQRDPVYVPAHSSRARWRSSSSPWSCTIVFDLTVAIVVGVGLGLILMVARLSKLQINYERVDMSRLKRDDDTLNERYRNAMVAYITGPLLFANIGTLEELPEHIGRCDTLLLSMRGVPSVDVSAAQTLLPMLRGSRSAASTSCSAALPSATMTMLRRAGIVELLGEQSFYWSVERALLDHRPRPLAAFDSAEA